MALTLASAAVNHPLPCRHRMHQTACTLCVMGNNAYAHQYLYFVALQFMLLVMNIGALMGTSICNVACNAILQNCR